MSKIVGRETRFSDTGHAGRILYLVATILLTCAVIVVPKIRAAEERGPTIIDPRPSAYGALPLHPYDQSKGVAVEERDPRDPSRTIRAVRYGPDALWPPGGPPARPAGLLIRGKVSDPSKRWVAVLARDEGDLRKRLATYRTLRASGDWVRALQLIRPIDVNVATSVAAYRGKERIKDVPEKVGTFFLTVPMYALDKRGWFIALLPHTPSLGGDIVDYGSDLGEQVAGMLQLEEIQSGKDYIYRMKILKAELSYEALREQDYSVRAR